MEELKDTEQAALDAQIAALRRMGPEGRLARTAELSRLSRELIEEGVRLRHPGWDERQIHREAIRIALGPELFNAAYGQPEFDDH